ARLDVGESAFWLLAGAEFSFDIRLALIDEATSSLDIQYFIWERDPTSHLFAHRVVQAADRGVRVRILLDDLTLHGQDAEFAALDKHPNISVRTFNPWQSRTKVGRVTEFLFRLDQVNHRMHNKIVLADQRFGIVGGRNIGDRYFGVWDAFVQNDLDVMAAGPVTADMAASFDLYWNSPLSYRIGDIVKPKAAERALEPTVAWFEHSYRSAAEQLTGYLSKTDGWDEFLNEIATEFIVGRARFEQDLPHVDQARPMQLYEPMLDLMAAAEERVLISTAYLIPDERFYELVERLENRGVDVTILTNSMASNNHKVAHTGYRPWRKKLLALGVELYEAREDSPHIREYTVPPVEPGFLGLHHKVIVVDDDQSFIGSPNIDPRSLVINTELGLFIESEGMAAALTEMLARDTSPEAAWRVYLNDKGRLRWESAAGELKQQPALSVFQRFMTFLINLLPLKGQA
ncbi:MAG: phospholipase D family protein, partial [Gammaproteobacteria bacterium]|nr:phospholipase D family protein [Gammaproteobacteria bacterium]